MDDQARLRQLADEAEARRLQADEAAAPAVMFMLGAMGVLIIMSFFTFVVSLHFWTVLWIAFPIIGGVIFKNRVQNYYKEKFSE